ncbi:serine/threonine protein kinase [Candidatus Protofrankia californiensis]|uniref:Serine/threonine protein kinase n=1 Tax=Candidatus Protofrankia californiensis TaxID=1839754 RepID=A0A1C3P8P5_9ACTN|nr:serine/threonine protein kinase [Candidatus Protofrankia californiensis]
MPTGGRASLGSRRRILLVVAAFVVFVGLPAGGLLVTARSAGLSGQQPAPEQAWRDVLVSLTNARSSAFAQADEAGLLDADALDSTAYARDLTLMRQMVAKGGRTSGLRQEIIDLAVRESGSEKTVLRITYRLPPYSYVDTAGTVLAQQPGHDRRQSDVTLVKTDKGWRLASWIDAVS